MAFNDLQLFDEPVRLRLHNEEKEKKKISLIYDLEQETHGNHARLAVKRALIKRKKKKLLRRVGSDTSIRY